MNAKELKEAHDSLASGHYADTKLLDFLDHLAAAADGMPERPEPINGLPDNAALFRSRAKWMKYGDALSARLLLAEEERGRLQELLLPARNLLAWARLVTTDHEGSDETLRVAVANIDAALRGEER